jgi:hypothetical protein
MDPLFFQHGGYTPVRPSTEYRGFTAYRSCGLQREAVSRHGCTKSTSDRGFEQYSRGGLWLRRRGGEWWDA